ncbi:MAG: barstar family protein [Allosphingosinicella sp.]
MAEGRVVIVDADKIVHWESLHDVFAEAFGFPDWYGRNMDAWIDLFSYMDSDEATTGVVVRPGETLTILLEGGRALDRRAPELYDAIVECAAFVNWRRIEAGSTPYLCLAYR